MNEIRFASTWRQNLLMLPLGLVLGAEQFAFGHWIAAGAFLLFYVPLMVFARWWMGIVLSPAGIEARGLRRQRIPWQQIQWIEIWSPMGTSIIRLHLFGGTKKRLRAPYTGPLQRDPDFVAKVQTVQQWWMHYTGQLQMPPQYQWPAVPPQAYQNPEQSQTQPPLG